MKIVKIIFLMVFMFFQNKNNGQSNDYLETLNFLLFEANISDPIVYKKVYKDSLYKINARYIEDPLIGFEYILDNSKIENIHSNRDKSRGERVEEICRKIRLTRDKNYIPILEEIIEKHENYFLKEWEPGWKLGGKATSMYEQQYSMLMSLNLTKAYLEIETNKLSSKQKFDWIINLIYLQWIDLDPERVDSTYFQSEYLMDKWNCACVSTRICSMDIFIEMLDDIKEELFQILENTNFDLLVGPEVGFYTSFLFNNASEINYERTADIVADKNESFERLILINDPSLKNSNYKSLMTFKLLHKSRNHRVIQLLLEDIFKESSFYQLKETSYSYQLYQSNPIAKLMFENRLIEEYRLSKLNSKENFLVKKIISDWDVNHISILLNSVQRNDPDLYNLFTNTIINQ